ncbi:MAG: hypothetical protein ACRCXL_12720 [Dermatophilaceae bacterium]
MSTPVSQVTVSGSAWTNRSRVTYFSANMPCWLTPEIANPDPVLPWQRLVRPV